MSITQLTDTPIRVVSTLVSRAADTNAYSFGDLINSLTTSTSLPSFNTGFPSKTININAIEILVGDTSLNLLEPVLNFYNTTSITGSTYGDNDIWNPTAAMQSSAGIGTISGFNQTRIGVGTNSYLLQKNVDFNIDTDINGMIYVALISNLVFTPIASCVFKITLFGKVMSI
jgi:hypothetical protein